MFINWKTLTSKWSGEILYYTHVNAFFSSSPSLMAALRLAIVEILIQIMCVEKCSKVHETKAETFSSLGPSFERKTRNKRDEQYFDIVACSSDSCWMFHDMKLNWVFLNRRVDREFHPSQAFVASQTKGYKLKLLLIESRYDTENEDCNFYRRILLMSPECWTWWSRHKISLELHGYHSNLMRIREQMFDCNQSSSEKKPSTMHDNMIKRKVKVSQSNWFFSLHFFPLDSEWRIYWAWAFIHVHYYAEANAALKSKAHHRESKYWKWKLVNRVNVGHDCVNLDSEREKSTWRSTKLEDIDHV